MLLIKNLSLILVIACAALVAALAGCVTRTEKPDVGSVVVAPRAKLPPVPTVVQMTEPKPEGYFQQELLNYSNGSPKKPTK